MLINTNRLKLLAVALVALPATFLLAPASAITPAADKPFDAATVYKTKCASCHGKQAEKKFDTAKTDEELVDIVLNSKKPGMPSFEARGVNAEQAKLLVTYMRSLRP